MKVSMKYFKIVALALALGLGAANAQAGHVFRVFAKGVRAEPLVNPAPEQPAEPVLPPPAEPEPPPPPPRPLDPNREQVALLTQFNGPEGTRLFEDATGLVGTGTGTARLSSDGALFGGTSLLLDGASSVTYQYSTSVNAVQDFTVEFWVRSNVNTTGAWANPICGGLCFSKFDGGWGSGYGNGSIYTNDLYFEPWGGGNYQKLIVARNGHWNDGRWHHIAVTRSQGVLRGFIDGAQMLPGLNASWAYQSAPVTFGRAINGGLDEVRLTYGVARYIGSFTPPASEFPY